MNKFVILGRLEILRGKGGTMSRSISLDPLTHQGTLQEHLERLAELRNPQKPPGWTWGIFWNKVQDCVDEAEINRLEAHIRGVHEYPPSEKVVPEPVERRGGMVRQVYHEDACPEPIIEAPPVDWLPQRIYRKTFNYVACVCPWTSEPHLHIR